MIDIENKVFNEVATELRTKYPGIMVIGEYVDTPSSFPCATLVEEDNSTYQRSQDEVMKEHHARLMYELNAYSNKSSGRKSEAKAILNTADAILQNLGFTRTTVSQIPNVDHTIFRMTARYEAVVEEAHTVGSVITHRLYRR